MRTLIPLAVLAFLLGVGGFLNILADRIDLERRVSETQSLIPQK